MADILSLLSDSARLDNYFSKAIKLNPSNYYAHLYYAKALSKLNDRRADELYKKAVSMRQDGDFQPVVDYAEHLLDRVKDIEALNVLEQLTLSEDYAYYPHFLSGVVYGNIFWKFNQQ